MAANDQPIILDPEQEAYRSVLEQPREFKNGFTWVAVAGAVFCGLLMMPGAIYLNLMTGGGIAAAWVTLIIFSEISRRAMRTLNQQEMLILLVVAGVMAAGGPVAQLIWRQYFVQSDAVRDIGLLGKFPGWFAPQPGSDALVLRNLWHSAWLVPILLVAFVHVIGAINGYTLSYFFFRITSDVERMPFPFANVNAQGSMALSESGARKTTWKWKMFSLGAMLGIAFGAIQIGIPLITGAVLNRPLEVIPLPWYDATTLTEGLLPATPTGLVIDLGLIIAGMVIPFWAVVGMGAGVVLMLGLNPLLHHLGVLSRWQPGMDTVATTFSNYIDFWMSCVLGVIAGITLVSLFQTGRVLFLKGRELRRRRQREAEPAGRREQVWEPPPGRGDFSPWIALAIYGVCSVLVVVVCHLLVPGLSVLFLVIYTFLYTPLISYLSARLVGVCGQSIQLPFVREAGYILSGYRGVEIWLAPIPSDTVGGTSIQEFRSQELTGTKFWSYLKAQSLVVPLSFALSFLFWGFIWKSGAIPSDKFPYAQRIWDLQSKNAVLVYSATLQTAGAKPLFYEALHPKVIAGSCAFTVAGAAVLAACSLPVMAVYGFLQCLAGGMPHAFIPIVIGALIARFYFYRKFGKKRFLEVIPVVAAGYGTGVGLIVLIGVAVNLIVSAVSASPF